jgi:hypothetical protein
VPSNTTWQIEGGQRTPVGSSSSSTPPNCTTPHPAPVCVVPQLKCRTLSAAKTALARAHCKLGTVHRPRVVARRHVPHVTRQSARAASRQLQNFAVNLTLN